MLANRNYNDSKNGQVVETAIQLLSELSFDMQDQFIVFRNLETGEEIVRFHRVDQQVMYQIAGEGWSQDLPLTLSDPDQLRNLPIMPDIYNSNTYARMDTEFHLYKEGAQYLRIAQGNPVTVAFTNGIAFKREADANPKLTIDQSVTTSSQRIDMSSQRISSLADPIAATDAVSRQFIDKYDLPIGTILSIYSVSTPASFLYCDGSSFDSSAYPELFAMIGSNTLPDLRGMFLRGMSDSNAVDPSGPRSVGSVQTDEIKSHTHSGTTQDAYFCENAGRGQNLIGSSSTDSDNDQIFRTATLSIDATGGDETRPKNITVRYVIKAKLSRNI